MIMYMVKGAEFGGTKVKHLEMIQAVINRLASNQFLFKGWSITIIATIATVATSSSRPILMTIPIMATLLFWFVDAYYLMLERAFRTLYRKTINNDSEIMDYDMDVSSFGVKFVDWWKTLWRPILFVFYVSVLIMLAILSLSLSNIGVEVILRHGS